MGIEQDDPLAIANASQHITVTVNLDLVKAQGLHPGGDEPRRLLLLAGITLDPHQVLSKGQQIPVHILFIHRREHRNHLLCH